MPLATSTARRVLPQPPGPASVTRRLAESNSRVRTRSSSRPTKLVNVRGRLSHDASDRGAAIVSSCSRIACSVAERGTGLETQLVDQEGSGLRKRAQRIGLPARPVQRDHQLLPGTLTSRVFHHERFEFTENLRV